MSPPVTFSLDADGVAWIIFDAPDARANVFNPATQTALAGCIVQVNACMARAVVVLSAKETIFIAGADLKWLAVLPDAESATAFSRTGQALFQQVVSLRIPVVCAIHGACAGGGYELALACHWRLASDAPATQIGLPEVGLGTIPGWGGSVRLPRLIGAVPALDHILRAKLLPAREALTAGLVDEVVPMAQLKERAKVAALRLAGATGLPLRPSPSVPAPNFFAELRRATVMKLRDQQPASPTVIDIVEQGAGLDLSAALEIEALAFGRVTAGEVCKNLVAVFFLRDAARKRNLDGWFEAPTGTILPIKRVGVVGAGVMGSGIAHWLAASGYEVVLRDVQPEFVERGREVVRGLFANAVKRGQFSAANADAGLSRLTTTTGWDGFESCDLVIEAIVENVAAKRQLFTELAGIVRPDALLVSNTSALPIEEIAGHVPRPERTLGLHFFNPVSRMPLVELVISRATSAESATRVLALVRALGKSPVIARSSPGFLMTRVLFFYLNAAVKLWEQGVPAAVLDGTLRDFGWPMGPLRLIDEVGVDVSDFIFHEMTHYFPARLASTSACTRLLAAGLKGRKNGMGAGFYTYVNGREAVNEAVPRPPAAGTGRPELSQAYIVDHLMGVMIDEACLCLKEGVVLSPADIDFALLSGAGFPAFRGGLMRYARSIGRIPTAGNNH